VVTGGSVPWSAMLRSACACAGVVTAVAAAGCKPNLNDTVSIVTGPQILAAQSDPAEAPPGKPVRYTALYVGAGGAITTGAVDWAFCDARKPLAELEPVSPRCLEPTGDWFVPIGIGDSTSGNVPADACRQFGPDVPQPQPGQPPGRPVDPDPTGGYYQPVRVRAAGANGNVIDVVETRLTCSLASAAADVAATFAQRYHANTNPRTASFGPLGAMPWAASDAGTTHVNRAAAGKRIEVEVAWDSCPSTDSCGDGVCGPEETALACPLCDADIVTCPSDCSAAAGCTGAERYVALDVVSGALVDRREALSVAWYATGGSFDVDRTGRDAADLAVTSDNGWTAPSQPGTVTMWIVLRDDRGGVSWTTYTVQVM
jgi:hypothetical protein